VKVNASVLGNAQNSVREERKTGRRRKERKARQTKGKNERKRTERQKYVTVTWDGGGSVKATGKR